MMISNPLEHSYDAVYQKMRCTRSISDYTTSLSFFDFDKHSNQYVPKRFDVQAVLSGHPFSNKLIQYVCSFQDQLKSIVDPQKVYFVKPPNLGLEYVVTKWHTDKKLSKVTTDQYIAFLDAYKFVPYCLTCKGFQLHTDGCIVLRGYDSGFMTQFRSDIRSSFPNLPIKQSAWLHIPIARILYNPDNKIVNSLLDLCDSSILSDSISETIDKVHYIHEHQWYMEDKTTLYTKSF